MFGLIEGISLCVPKSFPKVNAKVSNVKTIKNIKTNFSKPKLLCISKGAYSRNPAGIKIGSSTLKRLWNLEYFIMFGVNTSSSNANNVIPEK